MSEQPTVQVTLRRLARLVDSLVEALNLPRSEHFDLDEHLPEDVNNALKIALFRACEIVWPDVTHHAYSMVLKWRPQADANEITWRQIQTSGTTLARGLAELADEISGDNTSNDHALRSDSGVVTVRLPNSQPRRRHRKQSPS